jgi:hypothetical protein
MFFLQKVSNNTKCNIIFYMNIALIIIMISIVYYTLYDTTDEPFVNSISYLSDINNNIDNDITQSLNLGKCSRKCCPPYWSNNEIKDNNINDQDIGKTIYTSNLFCSNGNGDKGCICLTDKNVDLLSNRGIIRSTNNK